MKSTKRQAGVSNNSRAHGLSINGSNNNSTLTYQKANVRANNASNGSFLQTSARGGNHIRKASVAKGTNGLVLANQNLTISSPRQANQTTIESVSTFIQL